MRLANVHGHVPGVKKTVISHKMLVSNFSTRGGKLVTLEGGVLARGAVVKHESISTGVE